MTLDDRILDLLFQWEERCNQGQPITPEELCRDSPQLLDEIKKRIRDLERIPSFASTVAEDDAADSAGSPADPWATVVPPGPSPAGASHASLKMRYGHEV